MLLQKVAVQKEEKEMDLVDIFIVAFDIFTMALAVAYLIFHFRDSIKRLFSRKVKNGIRRVSEVRVSFYDCTEFDVIQTKEALDAIPPCIRKLFSHDRYTMYVLSEKLFQKHFKSLKCDGFFEPDKTRIVIKATLDMDSIIWHEFGHFVDYSCMAHSDGKYGYASDEDTYITITRRLLSPYLKLSIGKYFRQDNTEMFAFSFDRFIAKRWKTIPSYLMVFVSKKISYLYDVAKKLNLL